MYIKLEEEKGEFSIRNYREYDSALHSIKLGHTEHMSSYKTKYDHYRGERVIQLKYQSQPFILYYIEIRTLVTHQPL